MSVIDNYDDSSINTAKNQPGITECLDLLIRKVIEVYNHHKNIR
ncbi:MAG TPA: hypothetical protein PLO54_07030 [Bacilli bacterium]|nr:hypothetical protein [Bacilli bacterium]